MADAWGGSWSFSWGTSWGALETDYFEFAAPGFDLCSRCGIKYPERHLKKEWTGLRVCKDCWDPRHPQDFVKAVPERQSIIGARPEPDDYYLSTNEVSADDL